jgi:hypothetical protein
MSRIVLVLAVLALTALLVAVTLGGSVLAQDIPPPQSGSPRTGCQGIEVANDAQEPKALPEAVLNNPNDEETIGGPPPNPSQGEENSAAKAVGNAHTVQALDGPPDEDGP